MAVWKALGAWLAWTAAHAVAAVLFMAYVVVLVPPFSAFPSLPLDGLGAGVLFGLGQSIVLRWFLPAVRWWLLATVLVSPVGWAMGYFFAFATLGLGGWLGGFPPALMQALLLVIAFQRRNPLAGLALGYLFAAMLGSLVFYFLFLDATGDRSLPQLSIFPTRLESMEVGSVAFGAITGIVVALMVWFAARPVQSVAPAGASGTL